MSNKKELPYKYTLISQKLILQLKTDKTSLENNAFIPYNLEDGKFLSNLFFDRYKTLYNKVLSVNNVDKVTINDSIRKSMDSLSMVIHEEKNHHDELIKLAFKIVEDLFDLVIGEDVKINAKIGVEEISKVVKNNMDAGNIRLTPGNKTEMRRKSYAFTQDVKKEIDKRRLLNALTQGIANTFNTVFYLYEDELNRINPKLHGLYRVLIPNSEIFYYFKSIDDTPLIPGGICEVDMDNDDEDETPKLNAYSMCFPILIHEIIKGLFELISLNGLPEDEEVKEYVLERADYLYSEGWDMLLGIPLWQNLNEILPDEAIKDKHQIFFELVKLSTDEMLDIMPDILGKTEKGTQYLANIYKNILQEKKDDEMSELLRNLDSSDDDFLDINEL